MNIFVGNLGPYTHKEDLEEVFKAFGEVLSVNIVSEKYSSRSRGFSFVKMVNNHEALEAIRQLNNSELNGRYIVVQKVDPNRENIGMG